MKTLRNIGVYEMEVKRIPTRDIIDSLNKNNCNYADTGKILGRSRERIRVLNNSRSIKKVTFSYHKDQRKYDKVKLVKQVNKWLLSL